MQLNQARAVSFGIEHFRSLFPLNRGSIMWQINDCWPVVSWAAVDSLRHRKPLWYALRRVYAERLLTVQPREAILAVAFHNDSTEPVSAHLMMVRLTVDGEVLAEHELRVDVDTRSLTEVTLPESVAIPSDGTSEFISITSSSGERAFWYFVEDTHLALRAAHATASETEHGYLVRVEATGLVKDLTILADKVDPDASVDEALVTLLPGESRDFVVRARRDLDASEFASVRVVRSANDLVAAARNA